MDKKAQTGIGGLFQAVLLLVMITITVGLGVIVLTQMATQQVNTGTWAGGMANQSLLAGATAVGTVSTTWVAIIVIVVVVALVISILLGAFAFRKQ